MKRLCCRRPCASRGWSWVISFPPHLQVLPSRLLSDAIPREPLEPITSHPACEGVPMSCDWISQLRESVASESTETGQSSTLLRSHTRPFLRTRLNRLTSAGGGIRLYWLVSGRPKGSRLIEKPAQCKCSCCGVLRSFIFVGHRKEFGKDFVITFTESISYRLKQLGSHQWVVKFGLSLDIVKKRRGSESVSV